MSKISYIGCYFNKLILVFINLFIIYVITLEHLLAQCNYEFEIGETIYFNPLSSEKDLKGVVVESDNAGRPEITFENGRMRIKSEVHFLLWFPDDFSDDIAVSWEFLPKVDDGLAMFWFCATGRGGEDLFDKSLNKRTGAYPQYHSGDINAYHIAYFRRNPWDDPQINTVNLRKSYGFKFVTKGPNPIPNVDVEKIAKSIKNPYKINVIKCGGHIIVKIDDMIIQYKS